MLFCALLNACSAPRPAPSSPVSHLAEASPTPTPIEAPTAAPRATMVEESDIGLVPGLTPVPEKGPAETESVQSPTPEPSTNTTPAEPESMLSRIGPQTPPNVAAAFRLIEDGRQQLNGQHYDLALDRFERAVTIDPSNAYGYYFVAQVHYLRKHYDQAVAFANRAAVLSARTDPIWLARVYSLQGAAFEEVGRYPDARKAYEKAVAADPNNLAARVGVARLNSE